ncbi:sugar phosphate isomerase/epimerase [Lederbergia sp. NSJ-179]|uniref:sugar phosphate isomerase/epimerase family protein n=1 Tax=Lederbergia sp. NSJ-179 TaxID=2931402 RepID=UPI001FD443A1|nr:sugar phosphate isomerase/epimerase [Lederbergia sp. NSJ-179]MCJ7843386.1 sugar phosphate isomerase/epimerase [Lederbergia sp. NSJ-179]
MKLGMYSIEIKRSSLEVLFSAIREKGFTEVQFDFLSVGGEQLPASIDPALSREIYQTAQHNGVDIVAINGTYNMIHPDREQRNIGLQRFEVIAEACKDLHCHFITLCTGSRDPQNMWRFHDGNNTQAAWDDMMNSMEKVLEIAERYDLTLGIECEASNCVNSAKKARRLLDEFQSRRLKIIMDVANLFQKGQAKKEYVRPIIDEAFDLLGNDIYIAHGKDIKEGNKLHFTHAGNGIVDFPYYLEKLKEYNYTGGMLLHGIESEEDFKTSVDFTRSVISDNW